MCRLCRWPSSRRRRRAGSPIARTAEPALLAGVLRCAGCRHALKAKKDSSTGSKVYRCSRHHAAGTCPSPTTIYASVIEPHVEDLLLTEVASRSYRPTQETKAIEAAEREVEQATAELYAWVTDQSILGLGRDMYLDGLHARQAESTTPRRGVGRCSRRA